LTVDDVEAQRGQGDALAMFGAMAIPLTLTLSPKG
jgi:hypothetical protein